MFLRNWLARTHTDREDLRLFLENFVQDAAVAGGQRDAAKRRESGSDVCGGDGNVVNSVADSVAHEKKRHALVVVVRRSVHRADFARVAPGSEVPGPVGFRHDDWIAASTREKAGVFGAADRTLSRGTILEFFGAVNCGNSWDGLDRIKNGEHGGRIVFYFGIRYASEVNACVS